MPIMLHDMEAFLDDAQGEVRRMRKLAEQAYALAMAVHQLPPEGADRKKAATLKALAADVLKTYAFREG